MGNRNWHQLDTIAIGISALCVVQCLATPLLLALAPVLAGSALHGELFHRVLVLVILPVSLLAFFLGCWRHRRWYVLLPGAAGIGLISIAAVLGYGRLGFAGETAMTVTGSLFLAWAHVLNFRLCRDPAVCDHHADA